MTPVESMSNGRGWSYRRSCEFENCDCVSTWIKFWSEIPIAHVDQGFRELLRMIRDEDFATEERALHIPWYDRNIGDERERSAIGATGDFLGGQCSGLRIDREQDVI